MNRRAGEDVAQRYWYRFDAAAVLPEGNGRLTAHAHAHLDAHLAAVAIIVVGPDRRQRERGREAEGDANSLNHAAP